MAVILFTGASDDLIEIEGDVAGGLDEVSADQASFAVPDINLRVRAEYNYAGMWEFGLSKLDEDRPLLGFIKIEDGKFSPHAVTVHILYDDVDRLLVIREGNNE